jgi:ABC-type sugar transport system ATPase subunit
MSTSASTPSKWVDWWPVLLGLSFVLVTLFAPKGIGGLSTCRRRTPDRHGADLGPDPARCAKGGHEHASGSLRRLRHLRRVQGDQQPVSFQIGLPSCAPSSAPTARARPPSWTSSPARPGPTRARCSGARSAIRCCRCPRRRSRAPGSAASSSAPPCSRTRACGQPALALKKNRGPFAVLFDRPQPEDRDRVEELAGEIGLSEQLDRKAGELSHGQKQWLEIGMLLAQDPRCCWSTSPPPA